VPPSAVREFFQQPVVASFVAGGVAGAVSRTVVSPLERLKILFQVQSVGREEYKMSVPKALKKMWKDEGWRGLMAGNGTNCVRIVPYSAVQFGAYNVYKRVSNISLCFCVRSAGCRALFYFGVCFVLSWHGRKEGVWEGRWTVARWACTEWNIGEWSGVRGGWG
jgi:hypothetical protein